MTNPNSAEGELVYGSTDLTDGIVAGGLALTAGDKRLIALVMTALGIRHPAMDDLMALLMAARSGGTEGAPGETGDTPGVTPCDGGQKE